MKAFLIATVVALASISSFAEQTAGERTKETATDMGRGMKKGANRVKEGVCMEGDAECAAKKGKHRAEEGADKAGDKVKAIKENAD